MKTLIVIPAYNEEDSIEKAVHGLKEYNDNIDVVVVNDGSSDRTSEIVKSIDGVRLISLPYNLGYGGAVQTGFKYGVIKGYELIVTYDADGQHKACQVNSLISEIKTNQELDLVIGSRFIGSDYKASLFRSIGIQLFRKIIKLLTGQVVYDPTSGFLAINRRLFSHLAKNGNYPVDYPDADVITSILYKGFKIKEISVEMKEREYGESMHTGFSILGYIWKMLVSLGMLSLKKKRIKASRWI